MQLLGIIHTRLVLQTESILGCIGAVGRGYITYNPHQDLEYTNRRLIGSFRGKLVNASIQVV